MKHSFLTPYNSLTQIESVEDVLSLLGEGHELVLTAPNSVIATQILEHCVRAAAARKPTLLSFSTPQAARKHSLRALVDLSSTKTVAAASTQCKQQLAKAPMRSLVFVELAGPFPAQLTEAKDQLAIVHRIRRSSTTKRLALVWLVVRNDVSPDLLSALKDGADFFLDVTATAAEYRAQFLSAKGVCDAASFLPRRLTVQRNKLALAEVTSEAEHHTLDAASYRLSFENAPLPMLLFELPGVVKGSNKRAESALGYSSEEIALLKLSDVVPAGDLLAVLRALVHLRDTGKYTFSTHVRRKSGKVEEIEVNASYLGKNVYAAAWRNIEEQKRAEHDARLLSDEYKSFVSSVPFPYAIFINRKLAVRNAAFETLFPWVRETEVSLSEFFGRKNAGLLAEIAAMLEQPSSTISMESREILVPAGDRKHIATEVSFSVVRYGGKQALYCTFVDVAERRRILDTAQSTEEKFKTLLEGSPEAITLSVDGRFSLMNRRFAELFGYSSPLDLLGKEVGAVVAGRNARAQIMADELQRVENTNATWTYEYEGRKQDGTKILVVSSASRVLHEGRPAILTHHRDVTELRLGEERLDQRMRGIDVINRIMDDTAGCVTQDEVYQRALHAALKGTGFEAGCVLVVDRSAATMDIRYHRGVSERLLDKLRSQPLDEGLARFFDKSHEPLVVDLADYPPYLHAKSLFETEQYVSVAFLPIVSGGTLHAVLFLATKGGKTVQENDRILLAALARQLSDAVEKTILTEQVREARDRFDATVEQITDVLYTLQPDGTFVYLSLNVETVLGYRASDFVTNAGLWRTLVHPDDRSVLSQRISNQAQGKEEFTLEYRILPKGKATYIWLRDVVRYTRNAEQKLVAITGVLHDITDRRRLLEVEARLKESIAESEGTLRQVIDAMGDAVVIADLEGKVLEVNNAFSQLTGYDRGEVHLTSFPFAWVPDRNVNDFADWVKTVQEKNHLHEPLVTWVHRKGHPHAVSQKTTLLRNRHDEPAALFITAHDIAERRRLTLELESKTKQVELLNKIISHANTTADLDQIFHTIATEVHALVPYEGMSVSFIEDGQEFTPWYLTVSSPSGETRPVEQLDVDIDVMREALRTGAATVARDVHRADASRVTQMTIPLFVNEKALGAFSLTSSRQDAFSSDELSLLQPVADQIGAIIQRVRLFQQVRNDSTYIHNLLNSIDNVVYTVDTHYRITEVNKAWSEFMRRQGMEQWANEENIVGQSLQVILPDTARWEEYKRVMGDLFARRIETYARDFEATANGTTTVYHMVVNPMVIDNRVVALVFTYMDITDINRTEARLKRRNRELLALNAIVTSINKSLEVEEVIRVAIEQVKEAFDADVVAFYLLDDERRQLMLVGHWGIPEKYAAALHIIDIDASLTGYVVKTRKPFYIEDGLAKNEHLTEPGRKMNASVGLRSSGVIPLQSKDRVQGAFHINFKEPHAFTDSEQQLLVLIGNQIGVAVENAQLYAEVQQQVNTLTTLYELGKGLTGALDLKAMLHVVYHEVSRAVPLERFYYQAYLPEQKSLSLLNRTIHGIEEFYPAGVKVRGVEDWPNTIYQTVVERGTSYMGSTAEGMPNSMLAVPIKANNNVIGIISIITQSENRYKPVHLRLLESIANLTGVAIGKALLYEDTLKKTAELENRNKELDDFTYVVSHDLKEPLISIEGYSKIVMKDYYDRLDVEGKEYLGSVVQSTSRMKHLIEDLLTLSRLGRMQEVHELVEVKDIVDEILHDLQFSLREKNVTVRVANNMPAVQYSSTRLSMVFRNLISNAMKFNDKPFPLIDIGVREHEDEYEFSVADNGLGIEPQYFDRIFTIFQRLKRSEEFRGTGAGLTIAKKIVEMQGGRIWVTSTPGQGSTFYFTIKKPT